MSIQAGRTIKIIVVDDEPISADDMSDVIRDEFGKSMNVDVRTAYNAKSVIKMVEESPCDILLSDIQMPGMTGLQMVSRLREQFPDMRVLFLTGYDDFSFAYEAFRQHAVQYILKTEGDEVVLAAVKKEIVCAKMRKLWSALMMQKNVIHRCCLHIEDSWLCS